MRGPASWLTSTRSSVPNSPPAQVLTELYTKHGGFANAFSATFDPDLCHHIAKDKDGFVAYARSPRLRVTVAFFDPVCASDALPRVIDEFIATFKPLGRVGFWKISERTADLLAARGYACARYGLDNDLTLPIKLSGPRLRGLRREVSAARAAGVRIEKVGESDEPWADLAAINERWLATRARRTEIRRATRRCPLRHEPHCTKLVARAADGRLVGWAALDHLYRDGRLVGGGLSTVRWESDSPGIAALLAHDGIGLLQQQGAAANIGDGSFVLALGESPLASEPTDDSVAAHDALPATSRSRYMEILFRGIYKFGGAVYNMRGITEWKRKWRAEQRWMYVALERGRRWRQPWRETLAVVRLVLF